MTANETKLISINAALAERAERLSRVEQSLERRAASVAKNEGRVAKAEKAVMAAVSEFGNASAELALAHQLREETDTARDSLKAQIRDLETEKHALLQELPV